MVLTQIMILSDLPCFHIVKTNLNYSNVGYIRVTIVVCCGKVRIAGLFDALINIVV